MIAVMAMVQKSSRSGETVFKHALELAGLMLDIPTRLNDCGIGHKFYTDNPVVIVSLKLAHDTREINHTFVRTRLESAGCRLLCVQVASMGVQRFDVPVAQSQLSRVGVVER